MKKLFLSIIFIISVPNIVKSAQDFSSKEREKKEKVDCRINLIQHRKITLNIELSINLFSDGTIHVSKIKNGLSDKNFGQDGIIELKIKDFKPTEVVGTLCDDGKVDLDGLGSDKDNKEIIFIIRLKVDGSLDESYHGTGIKTWLVDS